MATYREDDKHVQFTAEAELTVGAVIDIAGTVGIVDSNPDGSGKWLAGDLATASIRGQIEIANPDGTAFADGAAVGYDTANDKAVVGGDVAAGTAVGAHAGTEATVKVLLPH